MRTSSLVFAAVLIPACAAKTQPDTAVPQTVAGPAVEEPAAVDPIPELFGTLTPQIAVDDVSAAMAFYVKAFGGTEIMSMPGPDGTVMHGEVKIGDSLLMIDISNPGVQSPAKVGGTPMTLFMYTADADEAWATAVAAGATSLMPLADMFWGDRYGELSDPFGHRWAIASNLEELTPEQMQQRSELFGAEAAEAAKPSKKKRRTVKRPATPKWKSVAGTPAAKPIPDGYETITMMITVPDAAAAIEFYTTVLGAKERNRMPLPDGKLMHAEVAFGSSVLMLSDEMSPERKSAKTLGGSPVMFHHYTPDVAATYAAAIQAGAVSILELTDMFWGDRYGAVMGPSGIAWGLATHVEDVAPEQMQERMKKQMSESGQAAPEAAAPDAGAPAANSAP